MRMADILTDLPSDVTSVRPPVLLQSIKSMSRNLNEMYRIVNQEPDR